MGIFGSRPHKARPAARQTKPSHSPRKYESVQIQAGTDACPAVQGAAETRYLCERAPLLPLSDCDHPARCACRYVHFSDRRSSPRRKSEGALPTQAHEAPAEERRRDQGRRAEELGESGERRSWFKNV